MFYKLYGLWEGFATFNVSGSAFVPCLVNDFFKVLNYQREGMLGETAYSAETKNEKPCAKTKIIALKIFSKAAR